MVRPVTQLKSGHSFRESGPRLNSTKVKFAAYVIQVILSLKARLKTNLWVSAETWSEHTIGLPVLDLFQQDNFGCMKIAQYLHSLRKSVTVCRHWPINRTINLEPWQLHKLSLISTRWTTNCEIMTTPTNEAQYWPSQGEQSITLQ